MSQPAVKKADQRTAITPTREEDFPGWYQSVIKAAEFAENSPVRGCMIIKPYGFAIWENMQRIFDDKIKDLGVQNAYFPLLIPVSFLAREAEHVEGFAKECAVVTHHRLQAGENGGLVPAGELEEPYVIRPTSETIIGDAMSRWIQSYRDLPLKLNQWCNVMRWEMRTRIFLRTSEFLWQEGHNAFETAKDAREDALKMLDAYADFAENALALAVIKGEKTADERFPGADATFTIEAMMQDGKALQAGTSHDLGQNFAKSCGIKFQGRSGAEEFAYTTSWGISTRLIGGMIMTHGDDDGMIMPPRVAPYQVVIIPFIKDEAGAGEINAFCQKVADGVKAKGLRAHVDLRDMRTPDKMWDSVKKGVPIRVEIGQREMEAGQLTFVRRDLGRESKQTVSVDAFLNALPQALDDMHENLLNRSRQFRTERTVQGANLSDVRDFFAADKPGFVNVPLAVLQDPGLAALMDEYKLSTRCMPFDDGGARVLIGKAY
jgi:prolyl-tRNA synthetase